MNHPVFQSEGFELAAHSLGGALGNNPFAEFVSAVERFERSVERLARIHAMQAENDQRKVLGHSMAYDEGAFLNA